LTPICGADDAAHRATEAHAALFFALDTDEAA
jgi:hypothetical protein